MKRKIAPLFAVALLAVLAVGAVPALAAKSVKYTVTLQPTKIKNSAGTPVLTGSGKATITLYSRRRQVCYSITVHDIKLPATHAYIQSGKRGSVGAIVVTLGTPSSSGSSSGCTRKDVRRSTISDITSNPKAYYVSVRTTRYPAGALRGQLAK